MADSIYLSGDLIVPAVPKIRKLADGWILGKVGYDSADLLLIHGLDYEQIEDPLYHRERFKALKGGEDRIQGNYILLRRGTFYILSGEGDFWEPDCFFDATGIGAQTAAYLMTKRWPTDNILKLGFETMEEISVHFNGVYLPMVWASSVEGIVRTYDPERDA